jgi:hypothetical protein
MLLHQPEPRVFRAKKNVANLVRETKSVIQCEVAVFGTSATPQAYRVNAEGPGSNLTTTSLADRASAQIAALA